jgi:hypothetical protein
VPHETVRSTIRRYALPTALGAVGVFALACDPLCPPITAPPRAPLGARYVLERVNGQPLPFVTQQSGTTRAGVEDEGTFTQTTILGTQEGTQPEVVSRVASAAGARRFTRGGPYDVVLTAFMSASSVAATVQPGADDRSGVLIVLHDGRSWQYAMR